MATRTKHVHFSGTDQYGFIVWCDLDAIALAGIQGVVSATLTSYGGYLVRIDPRYDVIDIQSEAEAAASVLAEGVEDAT